MEERQTDAAFWLHITIPILIAVVSAFLLADLASRPEAFRNAVASIDESREDVLKLAGSATAVSVAITALPGDLATPVAENLSDLSMGFLVVLCALYLEKFMLIAAGVASFRWLIPIACGIYIAGFLCGREDWNRLAWRVLCFAAALFLVVPIGTGISGLVQSRYGESIRATIDSAESCAGLIEESVAEDEISEETGNGLGQVLQNIQQTGDKIARGTSRFMDYLEDLMNSFIDVIAVMIVTSCIIPLLVLLCFVWVFRLIFGIHWDGKIKPLTPPRGRKRR